ncbi:MAG: hypothetical protein JNN26_20875 [Candidatus Obscuribacter sp.]|nr:hypothetical protein [Candidatus Obscuribacter sp.]
MKALALAVTLSLTFAITAIAQDSKPTPKSNGGWRRPAEAAANIDVTWIQKKIDELTYAIKREPKNDALYGARGQGYKRLGKLDFAAEDLTQAISLNPKRQAYFHIRGNVYGLQKRHREAYLDYTKALECGPKSHSLYLSQGQAAILAGDYKSALTAARTAQQIKPDDLETLVLLGSAEQMSGMLQESLRHLTRAIEVNPKDGGAFSIRSTTYEKLGQSELAKQDKAQAKRLGFQL